MTSPVSWRIGLRPTGIDESPSRNSLRVTRVCSVPVKAESGMFSTPKASVKLLDARCGAGARAVVLMGVYLLWVGVEGECTGV